MSGPSGSCFNVGCTTGYNGEKSHLFKLPKSSDVDQRNTWLKNIPKREIKFNPDHHRLCHLHFEKQFLVTHNYIVRNGERIPWEERLRWTLTSDAIPTVFSNSCVPKYYDKTIKKRKPPTIRIFQRGESIAHEEGIKSRLTQDAVPTIFVDASSVPKLTGKRKGSNVNSKTQSKGTRNLLSNNEKISHKNTVEFESTIKSVQCIVQKEIIPESPGIKQETHECDSDSNISIKEEYSFQYSEDDASNLDFNFQTLLQEIYEIVLPNENWIVRVTNEKSERSLSIINLGRLESGYVVVDKTCKINEDLEVCIRLNRIQRISGYPDRVENTQAISELLQKLDSVKLCPGVGKFNSILSCNLGVRRGSQWFSTSCDKILRDDNDALCKSCSQLNNYLLLV